MTSYKTMFEASCIFCVHTVCRHLSYIITFILTTDLPEGCCYASLTNEETEAQRGEIIFLMSHPWQVAVPGFTPRLDSKDCSFPV